MSGVRRVPDLTSEDQLEVLHWRTNSTKKRIVASSTAASLSRQRLLGLPDSLPPATAPVEPQRSPDPRRSVFLVCRSRCYCPMLLLSLSPNSKLAGFPSAAAPVPAGLPSAILQPSIASLSLFWRHLTSLGDQKSFLLFLLQGLVLAMQTCCTQPSRSRNRKLQLLTSMINQNHPSETDEVTDYLSELLSGSHGWTTLANKLRTTLANPLTSAASSRFWTLSGRCKSKRPGTKKRRSGRRNNHNRRYSGSGCSCCTQPNVEGVDGRGSSPFL
ncbi:hypothetical protein BHE74_00049280 [Ensete ventricosum]|nr:hypothetical protein BHE74_00049280 [Ensete ventricosum]